ncbi:MAG: hypothetical protein SVZ03_17340 [Spirochaetota bacterium]|nr:hypothetical protein [Spirochaetota bacterium]
MSEEDIDEVLFETEIVEINKSTTTPTRGRGLMSPIGAFFTQLK